MGTLPEGASRPVDRLWPVGLVLLLPLAGLALLLVRPELDLHWEHHPGHFWLVLIAAAVNVVLAYVTNIAAGRYHDARLILISLAFLSPRGSWGSTRWPRRASCCRGEHRVHVATPVGLIIASVFAPRRPRRSQARARWPSSGSARPVLYGVLGLMVAGRSSRSPGCRRSTALLRRAKGPASSTCCRSARSGCTRSRAGSSSSTCTAAGQSLLHGASRSSCSRRRSSRSS